MPADPPAFIKVEGIKKTYLTLRSEEVHALADISFDIGQGEFISLVGPSGCGKSTLLKILAGILAPTEGRIMVNGKTLVGSQKDIGMVFQNPVLLTWRKVLENVMLPVDVLGWPRKDYLDKAYELLKLVGLDGFEHKYPFELSGGMQQRVSLCRSLIHDPSFLLMDEPFGALDALTREEMWGLLQKVYLEMGKTVLFVTHNITEAVFLSHRVVVMTARPGRLGAMVDVELDRPRSLDITVTADFSRYVAGIRRHIGPRPS
jgi:NitT/TauT family transport system ATP-binding protein